MQVSYVVNVEVAEDSFESFGGTVDVNERDTINLTLVLRDASELPASWQDAITEEVYEQLEGVKEELTHLTKRTNTIVQSLYCLEEKQKRTNAYSERIEVLEQRIEELMQKHNELATTVTNNQTDMNLSGRSVRQSLGELGKRINDVSLQFADRNLSMNSRIEKLEKAAKESTGSSQQLDKRLGMVFKFDRITRSMDYLRQNDCGREMNIRLAAIYDMVNEARRYYMDNHE